MGAETSILKSYEIGKPYPGAKSKDDDGDRHSTTSEKDRDGLKCIIYPAVHRENGSTISVFVYDKLKNSKTCLGTVCAEALRLIRHPFVLKFIGVAETERHIKLMTEDILPLDHCIQHLESFEIIAGLHNILEALVFFHEKGNLVHANLNWSSVFVSKQDGSWKIGGMEKVEKVSLPGIQSDAISFAKFAVSVLDHESFPSNEEKEFVVKLEREFSSAEMIDATTLKSLLEEPVFRNSYLEITKFLTSITMKSDMEKRIFFSELADKLRSLNPETVAQKLLPKLMSKMMLAEPYAEKFFLPHLIAFTRTSDRGNNQFLPIFPEDIYQKYCVPLLFKLLRSKQTHVRLILLKYCSLFVDAIEKDELQTDVLPLILLGLQDENDAIVAATFHGLAVLVPMLGGAVVVGAERKKCFVDQRPKFADARRYSEVAIEISNQAEESKKTRETTAESAERKEIMERKRDERRKQMEQRRLERERKKKEEFEAKTPNKNEAHELSKTNTEYDGKQSSQAKQTSAVQEEIKRHEESEPDWEGFEAFSSGTASEEDSRLDQLHPTISAENLLSMSKESLQIINETPKEKEKEGNQMTEKQPNRKAMVLGTKKTETLKKESEYNRSDSFNSSASKDSDTLSQTDLYTHNVHSILLKGDQNLLKGKIPAKKSPTAQKNSKKVLGGEFEFEISVKKDTEPDFFADMTPDLSKSKTILIEKKGPAVSTKFEAIADTSEAPSGWDEEEW